MGTDSWLLLAFLPLVCRCVTVLPEFSEPIYNVTVPVHREVSLSCVVRNLGNYKVAWIHIDSQMILTIDRHVITRIPRFGVYHDRHKTWILKIHDVQESDRGTYMCQVNTEPMISQTGFLEVVVPPDILDDQSSQSEVEVQENSDTILKCSARGSPAPAIKWRREDGREIVLDKRKKVSVFEGKELVMTRVTRRSMGAYLCIASNGVPPSVSKRIQLHVEFAPNIRVPNQLVGAPAGTSVQLECITEAYPKAINYWVHEDVMLLSSAKYITTMEETVYKTKMTLIVHNLDSRDFSGYSCISKNSLGDAEGSIRLYEIQLPSVSPRVKQVKGDDEEDGELGGVRGQHEQENSPAQLDAQPSSSRSISSCQLAVWDLAFWTFTWFISSWH